ncbi:hypothetical protein GCM10010121_098910 [Streptomyces brasiliensis]|uniref:Uncharacterized protein n=1 Tax=Streptomyces brasiliensis TaxID=1954 RepID=A0A917PEE1_9ACTN|nr:hypothetical protein GCM10010121_098910 [Streptomyces brasiliensis]
MITATADTDCVTRSAPEPEIPQVGRVPRAAGAVGHAWALAYIECWGARLPGAASGFRCDRMGEAIDQAVDNASRESGGNNHECAPVIGLAGHTASSVTDARSDRPAAHAGDRS